MSATQATEQGTFDLATCTVEEFSNEVHNNAALRAEFLNNDKAEKFDRINKLLDGETGEAAGVGVTPDTTTQDQHQPADPDELTVTVKLKKDQLGSYLKNRSPEEAVLAKIRGKDEADRFIENLKTTNNHLSNQTITLQKQLQDATAKLSQTAPGAKEGAPALTLPKADDLKDIDLFDADGQKKVLDTLSALTEAVTSRKSQEIGQEPAPQGNPVLERQKLFEQNEKQQVYELQYQIPELSTKRDILEIDRDVGVVYNQMDRLAGGQGGVELYMRNDPQGQAFRERCSQAGVNLPEEYDKWYQIMSTRDERLKVLKETANVLSQGRDTAFSIYDVAATPNTSLVDIYNKGHIAKPAVRLAEVIDTHKQERTAAALPAGTVPEIPQSIMQSQLPADIAMWSTQQYEDFLNSKQLSEFTRDEAVIVKAIYEANNVKVPDVIQMKLR